jgi:hypothetical protein
MTGILKSVSQLDEPIACLFGSITEYPCNAHTEARIVRARSGQLLHHISDELSAIREPVRAVSAGTEDEDRLFVNHAQSIRGAAASAARADEKFPKSS